MIDAATGIEYRAQLRRRLHKIEQRLIESFDRYLAMNGTMGLDEWLDSDLCPSTLRETWVDLYDLLHDVERN